MRRVIHPELPKPLCYMTDAELEKELAEYDKEFCFEQGRAMPIGEWVREERARSKGRPRIGKGAKRVMVTIERGLLQETDRLARKQKTSRAQLIARGLRAVLANAA